MEIVQLLKDQIVGVDATINDLEIDLKAAKALKKKLEKAVKDFSPATEVAPAPEPTANAAEAPEAPVK